MDGVVCLLKPPGMTSSNAVFDVRRIFAEKRAGHLGTLDPGAAGVLPICIGRATRLFDFLVDKQKQYIFELTFGAETDTQDAYGTVLKRDERCVSRGELEQILPTFLGTQAQTAPVYSALKVDGKKMCDLARAGVDVVPKQRSIEISQMDLLEQTGPNRFLLKTTCSRGTYVRTICMDIGRRLGTCACMTMLIRSAAGPFRLEQSFSVVELEKLAQEGQLSKAIVSCEQAMMHLPAVHLEEDRRIPTMNGLETFLKGISDGDVRVYCGGFLGIGTIRSGSLKLTVHLYDER